MPDQCRCLNCGYRWYPRYRPKNRGPRRCPYCGKKGQYDVLEWWQHSGFLGMDSRGRPAGSERTSGCTPVIFLLIISIIILAFL